MELGRETEKELEEKVRGWLRAKKEVGVYVVCEGRGDWCGEKKWRVNLRKECGKEGIGGENEKGR